MCGIFCIYYRDNSKIVERDILLTATNEMSHRGPDDSGFFMSGNIGLGHRRLSIIDLSSGNQPMYNEDGSIVLVYNGEIYNHTEIRDVLISHGHIFKSQCDTEVIVHAFEEWGFECVKRFNGMFAFVLFDRGKKILWVVRDRLGIKPLYYFWDSKVFLCSSEIKPLLKTGLINAEININGIDAFLSLGYIPGPETLFKNIFKLKPGNFLQVDNDNLKEKEYWDFCNIAPSKKSFDEAAEMVAGLFKDSVEIRLMSDVPIGAFLSGGLDSSAVVSMMSPAVNSSINTFTVGYDKKYGVSEEYYAQIVAEKYGTNHSVFNLKPDDFITSLTTMIHYAEEPIVESPAIALYHLSRLAREKAIVLLSGEGGDEVFAGYWLYHSMNQIDKIQKVIPSSVVNVMVSLGYLLGSAKYQKYLDWLSMPLESRYQGTSCYLTDSLKNKIYTKEFLVSKGNYLNQTFSFHFNRIRHLDDPINKMLYVDSKTWLADDLLLKADKMTMAASIELRVPFLDHRLVEMAASLPSSYKCKNGNGKYILKEIMKSKLPGEIINRKKMGFPIPTKQWFGADLLPMLKGEIIDNQYLPWIEPTFIQKIVTEHQNGILDHSRFILTLLTLKFWQKEFSVAS